MDPFIFIILLFSTVLIVLILLLPNLKGKWAVYLPAAAATLSSWFIGLLLDANIDFGMDLAFRPVPCIGHGALYSEGHHKTKMTRLSQALSSPRLLFCTLFREKIFKIR